MRPSLLLCHLKTLCRHLTTMAEGKAVPKVFVFDLDGCCWDPEMYELWGGGAPFKENKDGTLTDKSGTRVHLLGDVKNILYELKTDPKYSDSIVAVASTCDEPKWARECIRKFDVGGGLKMFDVFQENVTEIYKAYGKDNHMRAIAEKTGVSLEDMIFFDNQTNNTSCVAGMKGPTVVYTPDGVTRALFEEGVARFPAPGQVIGHNGKSRMTEQISDKMKAVDISDSDQNPTNVNGNTTTKRQDYLEWSEYFMAVSFLSAMRSKDPATQVGACIVNPENRIVGIGYNGMPRGCSDDLLPWGKNSREELENKYMYVCHAEMNAILNKNSENVTGCSIYVALFPCNECAKMIIQSGIRTVIYFSDKHSDKTSTVASKKMMDMAGVAYRQFVPRMKKIEIDFDIINNQ